MDREASDAAGFTRETTRLAARAVVREHLREPNAEFSYDVALVTARDRILARRKADLSAGDARDCESEARALVGLNADGTAARMVAALLRDLAESQRANREAAEVLREVGTERALEAAEKCEACGEMSDRTAETKGQS